MNFFFDQLLSFRLRTDQFKPRKDNDYVVKLLDNFTFTGPKNIPYHALILEYLPGGDLSEYLKEKLLNGKLKDQKTLLHSNL